jgi:uncharacterized protein (TIGR03435 family)
MIIRFSILLLLMQVSSGAVPLELQDSPSSGANPKVYETVSIKPGKPGSPGGGTQDLPNGFRDTNITLDILVEGAYDIINGNQVVRINQVVGVPSWARSEPYDVEAKVDADTAGAWKNLTNIERWKQEQPMLRAMLADRCKLKVHFETKELPVYDLVIAKGGVKMKQAAPDEKPMERVTDGELTGRAMPIASLAAALPGDGRLIVDKTGLADKKFDFDLQWTPDNRRVDADSGPSLFTALEEQLGLKLVSSKAPGKVLVIDHIEKPSPN